MPGRFFDLYDDVYIPHRWHLATPVDEQGNEVEEWDFKSGTPVKLEGRLTIPVEIAGKPLDFTEAGIRVPVVHVRAAHVFAELAADDVQLIPVTVEGQPDQYLILVATRLIRCIDEKTSRIRFWTPEDGQPDRVGQYRDVRDLHVDKSRVGSAKVFRPEGWSGTLIVSEEIKEALERIGALGTKFQEV
jgi:hypothetical protein